MDMKEESRLISLRNDHLRVALTDIGASLVSLEVVGDDGEVTDVALGFERLGDYRHNHQNVGAIVGRVANRTAGARFNLEGRTYELARNEGRNNNHSGPNSWTDRTWHVVAQDERKVTFGLTSPDGDQGFPGTLDVEVTYALADDALEMRIRALAHATTLANIISHGYYNLNGHASGTAMHHMLWLNAEAYTPVGEDMVPTGEVVPVEGTPYDFRTPKHLDWAGMTYDTNFVLKGSGELRHAARLVGDVSGIAMDVYADRPGLQLYTANYLETQRGKDGACYRPQGAVCLETQLFPDAVHHAGWQSPVLRAGERLDTLTRLRFSFMTDCAGQSKCVRGTSLRL